MQLEDTRAILRRVEGGPDGVRTATEDALRVQGPLFQRGGGA